MSSRPTPASPGTAANSHAASHTSSTDQLESPATINRLPIELLILIFRLAEDFVWKTFSALEFGMVCRHWRNIITGTANFWTDIRVGSVDLARLSIERSQQAPLSFSLATRCPVECCRGCHLDSPFLSQCTLLTTNIRRIRSITVHINYQAYSRLLPHLAHLAAPSLKTLSLTIPVSMAVDHYASLSQFMSHPLLDAPSLEYLQVDSKILLGEFTHYPQISKLSLLLGPHEQDIESSFIIRTLQAHDKLTKLDIHVYSRIILHAHDPIVQLPLLKRLKLKFYQPDEAHFILHRMEIPEIAKIKIVVHTGCNPPPEPLVLYLVDLLKFLPPTFLERPTTIVFVSLGYPQTIIQFNEGPGSQYTLEIRFFVNHWADTTWARTVAQSLVGIFPSLRTAFAYNRPSWESWEVPRDNVGEGGDNSTTIVQ